MLSRLAAAALLLLLYALLCKVVFSRHRRRLQQAADEAAALLPAADGAPPLLVLHASQTGQAEDIAWQTAKALHLAGMPVKLATLGETTRADLRAATHALVIAATYGEGDPPDSAAAFARDLIAAPDQDDLAHLHIGVLALGDDSYAHYCGFGRALDAWLQRQGAQPLFERIDVNRADEQALAHWRQRLSHLAGTMDLPEWEAPVFQPWTLAVQQHLNPGSQGGPVYHLELTPPAGEPLPDWQAGDLVQVHLPGNEGSEDAQRPREYTIASLPTDGRVHLMVRQTRREDGSPGLASGLLTARLRPGDGVALRLRAHGSFRIGENAGRRLILIGNGTGLAGLRAHLKARAAQAGAAPAWLLFGERQAAHDAHYRNEIEAWQRQGLLAHADWAFSRDQDERLHVQHLLARESARLREWVDAGAALYVCGSLQGMAGAVDAVLRETLGDAVVDQLTSQGRYRRDVY